MVDMAIGDHAIRGNWTVADAMIKRVTWHEAFKRGWILFGVPVKNYSDGSFWEVCDS